jgi:hypothetical protein
MDTSPGRIVALKFTNPAYLEDMLECYGVSEQAVKLMVGGKSRLAFIFVQRTWFSRLLALIFHQRTWFGGTYIIAIADFQMASKFKSFVEDIHDLGAPKKGVSEMDASEAWNNKKIVGWVEKCNMATEDTRPLR